MFIGLLVSCSKNDSEFVEINGRYLHEIPNCDNSEDPEINCVESVQFIGNSQAEILIGGGDIGYRVNYQLKGKKIEFKYENGNSVDLSFNIENETTIIRIENNEIWKRE